LHSKLTNSFRTDKIFLYHAQTAVGNRRADNAAPSIRKGWYLQTSGSRSVGIVRLRTKATEFKYCHLLLYCHIITSVLLYYYYYHVLLYCHIINSALFYNYFNNVTCCLEDRIEIPIARQRIELCTRQNNCCNQNNGVIVTTKQRSVEMDISWQ
jgi:hypothetical protein